jgi:hypothetical protein
MEQYVHIGAQIAPSLYYYNNGLFKRGNIPHFVVIVGDFAEIGTRSYASLLTLIPARLDTPRNLARISPRHAIQISNATGAIAP